MATFINRTKEITFLTNWLQQEPNSLLFIYGPKSCGKTTLINELIEHHLDLKKMAINYMNLRGVLIYNFQSFLDSFFTKSTKSKIREILAGATINLGFFKVGLEEEALLKQNPFRVMEGQLTQANKKGLTPVLIIDEIQNLKNIYVNGERHLLDELFNLFVRLTKEIHIAHVILLTSDSYFIEDIYNNARLKKTAEFYLIDHLEQEAVVAWLAKEQLNKTDAEYIWDKLGGSTWEISRILSKYQMGESIESACNYFINEEYGKLKNFLRKMPETTITIVNQVHQDIVNQGYAIVDNHTPAINTLIPQMVEQDFWFFRSDTQQIIANSKSIHWAMKQLIDTVS